MKIAVIVVRVLVGLLLLFGSVAYFLKLFPQPELKGDMKELMEGFAASKYIMDLVKAIEFICGIAFLSGYFVPLATVVIFPITINIVLVHAFLDPAGIGAGLFLLISNLFLAYYHRAKYQPMLAIK